MAKGTSVSLVKHIRVWHICLLLFLLTAGVFWRVLASDFVNYDDNQYVTENRHVLAGLTRDSIVWAFTATHSANWHPLTWLSHMADASLYGKNPAGHHATNLVLHIANTLLLFLVLLRLTSNPESDIRNPKLWRCAFVAALFSIHPLHVESVAWIAERKDVLSTFFFLLIILAYARYVRKPGVFRYLPVVGLFALGLLAKPMLVTLPFVLLLLDYWPLGRLLAVSSQQSAISPDLPSPVAASRTGEGVGGSFRSPETRNRKPVTQQANTQHRTPSTGPSKSKSKSKSKSNSKTLLLEKVPLFILAAGSCVVTFVVQQASGAAPTLDQVPLNVRIANALVAYVAYIRKMLWPSDLSIFYPHPIHAVPLWQTALAALVLCGISAAVLLLARRGRGYLGMGWLWYLGTLVPVIGLVQVGEQAMADRYTYIPFIGLFVMVAWGVPELLRWRKGEREKGRKGEVAGETMFESSIHPFPLSSILALAVLATLSAITWRQVGHWKNSETLFRHALAVTSGNYRAHNNLGSALKKRGELEEAAKHYREALRIKPTHAHSHTNLGNIYLEQGRAELALREYRTSISINDRDAIAHYDLGIALTALGRLDEAVAEYRRSIELDPEQPRVYVDYGAVLSRQGKIDKAIAQYTAALTIDPSIHQAHRKLADLLAAQGKTDEAISHYQALLEIKPDDAQAHYNLGSMYGEKKQLDDEIEQYRKAIRLDPKLAEAHNNLAVALYFRGDYAEAWKEVRESRKGGVSPNPDFVSALRARMPEPR